MYNNMPTDDPLHYRNDQRTAFAIRRAAFEYTNGVARIEVATSPFISRLSGEIGRRPKRVLVPREISNLKSLGRPCTFGLQAEGRPFLRGLLSESIEIRIMAGARYRRTIPLTSSHVYFAASPIGGARLTKSPGKSPCQKTSDPRGFPQTDRDNRSFSASSNIEWRCVRPRRRRPRSMSDEKEPENVPSLCRESYDRCLKKKEGEKRIEECLDCTIEELFSRLMKY
ncbi:hypothetical protein KM043_005412 [Ampulex compressa]|nr:hypothetical protein KM043_005412 [Ampulex compressa]